MERLKKGIERVEEDLKRFNSCALYYHGYSRTPLNESELEKLKQHFKDKTIVKKINSHNVEYFSISQLNN